MNRETESNLPAPCECEFHIPHLTLKLDRVIESKVDAISPVVEELMRTIKEHESVHDKDFEIETALRESLANAIIHGNRQNPRKHVRVCCACHAGGGVLIIVKDQGEGFDPAKVPSPTTGQNIFRSHGRGIYLMNLLMDDVRFEKGGTEIHMRKGALP
jgi:serine/threonine-protein kinase RsbW